MDKHEELNETFDSDETSEVVSNKAGKKRLGVAVGVALVVAAVVSLSIGIGTRMGSSSSRRQPSSSSGAGSLRGESLPPSPSPVSETLTETLTVAPTTPRCPMRTPPPPLPGKKGVCLRLQDDLTSSAAWTVTVPLLESLNPSWNYSWGLDRIQAQPSNVTWLPMAWGAWQLDALERKLQESVKSSDSMVLGFNEPDQAEQSNMEVSHALAAWPHLEALDKPLVSPSAAKPLGQWMQKFMDQADAKCLRIDWIGVHWYGNPNFEAFRSQMIAVHQRYGNRPLLLTEFAVADWQATTTAENRFSKEQVLAFARQAIPWLEETEWIAGYAWFPFEITLAQGTSSALWDESGTLTALGRYYASVGV